MRASHPTSADDFAVSLCCPDCREPFAMPGRDASAGAPESGSKLVCRSCGSSYAVVDGVPELIGKSSQLNLAEVATQDHVADHYDEVRYQRASSIKYHEDTMEQLIELAPPRGTILDDGCGTGAFLEFVRRRALPVERYVGIDVSRGMLRHAKRRLDSTGTSHRLVLADACRLPFAAGTFDVVYARSLLHHLPDPALGLREIARVLAPGGVAVMLDPNKTIISALPRYLARRTDHFDSDHKNFHVDELQRWVRACLTLDQTRFFGYVAYPLFGFPDLIDFDRLGMGRLADGLMRLDRMLGVLPGIRRLGWGVMISARK
jgi:ubiquinone/menaquinone biosynthesis C-methylase UbiE/uncharacterized protein YbaR (Trm112 family)